MLNYYGNKFNYTNQVLKLSKKLNKTKNGFIGFKYILNLY
jgi:hypothetical protein